MKYALLIRFGEHMSSEQNGANALEKPRLRWLW